ncbi:MAG: M50 family metallopeptidase [Planctomycetes bacterium]|nr:M50 family metallopeptidase [Planctomycetota bacterium]
MFLIRWVVAAIIVCVVFPYCLDTLASTWQRSSFIPSELVAVLAGSGLAIAMIFWKKPNWLIHTIIHESAHAIACFILRVKIRNFQASDGKGGVVVHDKTGPIRSTIISLAPYTIPLVLIPLFIATWFIDGERAQMTLSGCISFAFIHHLHGLFHNIRLNFWGKQADLTKAGRILSIVCIASCLVLVTAWTLKVLTV